MDELRCVKLFGKNLRHLIERHSLTQKALANELGVDPVIVSRWLRGQTWVTPRNLERLSEFFEVEPSFFFSQPAAKKLGFAPPSEVTEAARALVEALDRHVPVPYARSNKARFSAMIVEDEATLREDLTDRLMRRGFATIQAPNGQIAWDLLEAQAICHLIICDNKMPVMGGRELFLKIRKKYPAIIRVIASGTYIDTSDSVEVYDFLLKKPYTMTRFDKVIDEAEQRLTQAQESTPKTTKIF